MVDRTSDDVSGMKGKNAGRAAWLLWFVHLPLSSFREADSRMQALRLLEDEHVVEEPGAAVSVVSRLFCSLPSLPLARDRADHLRSSAGP